MVNQADDVIFSGNAVEVIAQAAPSGRLGIEIYTPHCSRPQEPEAIAFVRDVLTKFLTDNGYE